MISKGKLLRKHNDTCLEGRENSSYFSNTKFEWVFLRPGEGLKPSGRNGTRGGTAGEAVGVCSFPNMDELKAIV